MSKFAREKLNTYLFMQMKMERRFEKKIPVEGGGLDSLLESVNSKMGTESDVTLPTPKAASEFIEKSDLKPSSWSPSKCSSIFSVSLWSDGVDVR